MSASHHDCGIRQSRFLFLERNTMFGVLGEKLEAEKISMTADASVGGASERK